MENTKQSQPSDAALALTITGMTCDGCAKAVGRVLSAVPGVTGVTVDRQAGRAMVVGTAPPQDLMQAVKDGGYGAQLI